jgi:hypothetical protein
MTEYALSMFEKNILMNGEHLFFNFNPTKAYIKIIII